VTKPPALLFGVPIADVTMDETVDAIADLVAHGRATGRTYQVATVNVDFLVNALDDRDVLAILQNAALCIADGMPIVWGARLLGMPLRERVAGADLVPRLVDESQRRGWHVHIFGSTAQVAERSTQLLRQRFPGASFSIDPGPLISDVASVSDVVLDSIRAVDADIVCIALGNPKQERFIAAHQSSIRAPIMIGIGGSLDMLVGKRRRAPEWVQRVGLEWVVRAAQEPRRLGRRYARDIGVFGPRLARASVAAWRRRNAGGLELHLGHGTVEARLGGDLLPPDDTWSAAAARLCRGADLIVTARDDIETGRAIRDDAAARLVGLVAIARRFGSGTVRWDERTTSLDLVLAFAELGVPPEVLGLDIG
jgi:N-acetylglucosaminyldiphosphoundecaprenol N-acetyl-beta-D-mannosaminyltransferase